jgi:hypothetical protein
MHESERFLDLVIGLRCNVFESSGNRDFSAQELLQYCFVKALDGSQNG